MMMMMMMMTTALLLCSDSDRSDAVVAVACTNLISLRKGDERIFDSEKKSKLALRVPHEKLTKQQRIAIKRNHALLLMYEKLVRYRTPPVLW